MNSSLDIAVIRRKAIEAVAGITGSEAGNNLFLDEETGELYFDVAVGEKGKSVAGIRLKRASAGWVGVGSTLDFLQKLLVYQLRNGLVALFHRR